MDSAALELDAVKFAKTAVTYDQNGKYNEAVFYYKVNWYFRHRNLYRTAAPVTAGRKWITWIFTAGVQVLVSNVNLGFWGWILVHMWFISLAFVRRQLRPWSMLAWQGPNWTGSRRRWMSTWIVFKLFTMLVNSTINYGASFSTLAFICTEATSQTSFIKCEKCWGHICHMSDQFVPWQPSLCGMFVWVWVTTESVGVLLLDCLNASVMLCLRMKPKVLLLCYSKQHTHDLRFLYRSCKQQKLLQSIFNCSIMHPHVGVQIQACI